MILMIIMIFIGGIVLIVYVEHINCLPVCNSISIIPSITRQLRDDCVCVLRETGNHGIGDISN